MEQFKWQNVQKINLKRIFVVVNTLSDSEERKRKDNIKDIKNLFTSIKELDNSAIKDIRNFFGLKKENETIKYKVIGDIRNLFRLKNETIRGKIVGDLRNTFKFKKKKTKQSKIK